MADVAFGDEAGLGGGRLRLTAVQLLLGIGMAGLLGWAVRVELLGPRQVALPESFYVTAFTNEGRPITLVVAGSEKLEDDPQELAGLRYFGLERRVTRTAPSDASYNCHGWVFTRLRCQPTGAVVELILHDNGYQETATPQENDLVVYRNGGRIVHSGVVHAVEGERVLVESKWGEYGRYLHLAPDQIYGSDIRYYRSGRCGHLLKGLPDFLAHVP